MSRIAFRFSIAFFGCKCNYQCKIFFGSQLSTVFLIFWIKHQNGTATKSKKTGLHAPSWEQTPCDIQTATAAASTTSFATCRWVFLTCKLSDVEWHTSADSIWQALQLASSEHQEMVGEDDDLSVVPFTNLRTAIAAWTEPWHPRLQSIPTASKSDRLGILRVMWVIADIGNPLMLFFYRVWKKKQTLLWCWIWTKDKRPHIHMALSGLNFEAKFCSRW